MCTCITQKVFKIQMLLVIDFGSQVFGVLLLREGLYTGIGGDG